MLLLSENSKGRKAIRGFLIYIYLSSNATAMAVFIGYANKILIVLGCVKLHFYLLC